MSNIGITAIFCLGVIYAAYSFNFYPMPVTVASLGFLAYTIFSRPSTRRPSGGSYLGD